MTVVIVGISSQPRNPRRLFSLGDSGQTIERQCEHINPYLAAGESVIVDRASRPQGTQSEMTFGNTPIDGGYLLLSREERDALQLTSAQQARFVRRIYGSAEFIRGLVRYCLWIDDQRLDEAEAIPCIARRIRDVRSLRLIGGKTAQGIAEKSHQFQRMNVAKSHTIIVPGASSEARSYLPVGLVDARSVVSNLAFAVYDAPLWNLALIGSRLHLVWIATVCGKLKTDFRYSNTLGWNTFPVPRLTDQNVADLTRRAEEILLAREGHYPASITELYDPEKMPADLRQAHERNDEVLERIYIGRLFRNDTERLEKLFAMYTHMMANGKLPSVARRKRG